MDKPPGLALKDWRWNSGSSLLPPAEGMGSFQSPQPFPNEHSLPRQQSKSEMLRGILVWNSGKSREDSYTGKRVKIWASFSLSLPPVQVNFVACQLFALFAAFWFRIYLSPGKTSPDVRHAFVTIFGIYFVIFCFGWWVWALDIVILIIWVFCGNVLGICQALRKQVFTPIVG